MNGGTNRGAAFGFKLESILRLSEVRSEVDGGKTTGLHFVLEMLNSNYPDALGVVQVCFFFFWNHGFVSVGLMDMLGIIDYKGSVQIQAVEH